MILKLTEAVLGGNIQIILCSQAVYCFLMAKQFIDINVKKSSIMFS
jgi:hypothetical protein